MLKRRTMGDIAEKAGVSRSTVSRVLNGEPVVSEETAAQVRRLAAEMGYRMRPSRKQGRRVGMESRRVVVISQASLETGGGGLAAVGSALLGALSEMGCMAEFVCWDSLDIGRINGVAGAVLLRGVPGGVLPECLAGIPCVQLLELPDSTGLHVDVITMDYHMVGVLAADWLHEQGCKSLVTVVPDNPVASMRELSFEGRARAHGCNVTEVKAPVEAIEAEDASALVARITKIKPRPDGLFAFNDHTLLALYSHLVKSGFDLDHGLRMIGCDAEPFVKALSPRPATIDTHIPEMARRAAETLLWRIGNPAARPVTIMLRPEVVETK